MSVDSGSLKSLTSLWRNLATHQRYQRFVDQNDIDHFTKRVDNEGLTFLTTVLPRIGKALDRFHSTFEWHSVVGFQSTKKTIVFQHYEPFKSHLRKGRSDFHLYPKDLQLVYDIPIFLGFAIEQALRGDSQAVDCVRQLTLIFYKYEVDYDDEVVGEFLDQFIKTDSDLPSLEVNEGNKHSLGTLLGNMKRLIAEVLCNTDPRHIRPCHGGGATACHTANKDKWRKFRYIEKLDSIYPYADHFFYSPTHLVDDMGTLEEAIEVVSPNARVCLVPKDSRGPRVISCEPAEHMFIQQGLMTLLYEVLETCPLTSGLINFTDQTTNRCLAMAGSLTGEHCTIDLSEASDRVSLKLVELVFPQAWVECFAACRSEATYLPNGKTVRLNKFAPMGSACCFAVEALVFWACAEASTWNVADSPFNTGFDRSIHVYGDDIICSPFDFEAISDGLHSIGLLVNSDKSYKAGPFRESCGGDFHLGVNVTPIRVRKVLSSEGTGIIEGADLVNLFLAKLGEQGSGPFIETIELALDYNLPRSLLKLPATIRLRPSSSNDVFFSRRWNKNHQRYEHRVLCQSMEVKTFHPSDWWELLRKELSRHPSSDSSDIFTSLFIEREDQEVRYENVVKIRNSKLLPGQYADLHSARMKWSWTWLGEPRGEELGA